MQAAVQLGNGTGRIQVFNLPSLATKESSVTTAGVLVGLVGSVQPSPSLLLTVAVS